MAKFPITMMRVDVRLSNQNWHNCKRVKRDTVVLRFTATSVHSLH